MAHQVAFLETRIGVRLHDPADAAPDHGDVQRLIGGQSRPHVGIDRHDQVLHLQLAVSGVGCLHSHDSEIGGDRDPLRAAHEVNLTAG